MALASAGSRRDQRLIPTHVSQFSASDCEYGVTMVPTARRTLDHHATGIP
jgi:hypothetical protein